MEPDHWTQAVREQLGFGRLLPLGEAAEGAWIAESAVASVLRAGVAEVAGVRIDSLRIGLADPDAAPAPAVPPPASGLPPGLLRVTAGVAVTAERPIPVAVEELRDSLLRAAEQDIGLLVEAVDLNVTGLLDELPPAKGRTADGPASTQVDTVRHGDDHVELRLKLPAGRHALDAARGARKAAPERRVTVLVTSIG